MSQSMSIMNIGNFLKQFEKFVSKSSKYYYDILYDVSIAIFDKRLAMKKTQKEFAEILEVSQAMVSKYESGEYNFTIKQLCNIAEKLNLKPNIALNEITQKTTDFKCEDAPVSTLSDTNNIGEAA